VKKGEFGRFVTTGSQHPGYQASAPARPAQRYSPAGASILSSVSTPRYNKEIKAVSRDALNALLSYDFPGNIRELEMPSSTRSFLHRAGDRNSPSASAISWRSLRSGIANHLHVKDFDELEKLYLTSVLAEMGGARSRRRESWGFTGDVIQKVTQAGIIRILRLRSE